MILFFNKTPNKLYKAFLEFSNFIDILKKIHIQFKFDLGKCECNI